MTRTFTYDSAGNLTDWTEYAYTTGTLGTATASRDYTYDDSNWGDLLTGWNGNTVTGDGLGNMLSDGTRTYTWRNGRELATVTKSGVTWANTYNADGIRTKRTDGTTAYSYVYNGGSLSQMTVGSNVLNFAYDASGTPMAVTYGGTTYYYVTNIQGDVTAILNSSGTAVVNYTYDAWGNILTTTGILAATLGVHNPLRYRGYVYDQETGLYYLQSRYYNPAIGRFLSADTFVSTGQGILGNNMFAYCLNNPVTFEDDTGSAAKLCFGADGRIDDAPWRDHSPGGGGRPMGNYTSGNDYGSVADKFYTVRVLKFLGNTDEQAVLDAECFAFYKGCLVIRTNGNRSGSFGCLFITRETNHRPDAEDVVRHEYGHTRQLVQLGPVKYLLCIVIPSFFEWGSDPVYYRRPWEITADIYGEVQSRSYPGYAGAGFKYLENSRNIGIGAWLTIR